VHRPEGKLLADVTCQEGLELEGGTVRFTQSRIVFMGTSTARTGASREPWVPEHVRMGSVRWTVAEVDSFEQRYWIRMHSKVSQVPQVPNGPSVSHSSAGLQSFKEGVERERKQGDSMAA
jgi:hypothetical protein